MSGGFISDYVDIGMATEAHSIYHRWSCISSIGALLGRNYYFPFGHFRIFPNTYIKLIGASGSRKSTSIKIAKKLVAETGYEHISSAKLGSIEKFLLDLEGTSAEDFQLDSISNSSSTGYRNNTTSQNLWGTDAAFQEPKEAYIVADEFNEFAGAGNINFYSTLGDLWDWDQEKQNYEYRLKNSKSVSIYQPTISILGGNTQEGLARAFPPDIGGQGFLSRVIFIYGVRSGREFHIPPAPDTEADARIISSYNEFKIWRPGRAEITTAGDKLLECIYKQWRGLDDARFKAYAERRYTQLIKLALICSAAGNSNSITEEVIIEANTYLTAAEKNMPAALGEFGKGRNSDVANSVLDYVRNAGGKPPTYQDIWKSVHRSLNKPTDLQDILQNLCAADQIQSATALGKRVYLPLKIAMTSIDYVDWTLLTEEERKLL